MLPASSTPSAVTASPNLLPSLSTSVSVGAQTFASCARPVPGTAMAAARATAATAGQAPLEYLRFVAMIQPPFRNHGPVPCHDAFTRSEEHTSELQSLMRNSY